MSKSKIGAVALIALVPFGLCALAGAGVVEKGNVRVNFQGKLTPHSLPRAARANVRVSVAQGSRPRGR